MKYLIDINKAVVKEGDFIRIYNRHYLVVMGDDGNLWAKPVYRYDTSKLLINWNGEFEIIKSKQ